jgi:uncharacterized membrane protein
MKFKQKKLPNFGQIIGLIGLFFIVGITRILGVHDSNSESATLGHFLLLSVGTGLIILITRLGIAAYKSKEESPRWIKWILSIWK